MAKKSSEAQTVTTKPKKTRQGAGKNSRPRGNKKLYRGQGR